MKKIFYFLLCSFLYCTTGFSNGIPILTSNDSGGGPGIISPDKDCHIIIPHFLQVDVFVANLAVDKKDLSYVFPSGAADLYIELSVSDALGVSDIHRINLTNYNWAFVGTYGDFAESVYKVSVNLWVDLDTYCPVEGVGSDLKLLTYNDLTDEYLPYPVCLNNDGGGLFSCHVFDGVPCVGEPCNSGDYTTSYGATGLPYECESCYLEPAPPGSGSPLSRKSEENTLANNSFECSVLTNPFSDELNINWLQTGEDQLDLRLFNATGQLIETFSVNSLEGSKVLNSTDLPNGIYFLIATQGDKQETIKLVKN